MLPKIFSSENWYGLERSFEDEDNDHSASNSTFEDVELTAHKYNVDEWDSVTATEEEWMAHTENSTFVAEAEETVGSVVSLFDVTKGDMELDRQTNNTWNDW